LLSYYLQRGEAISHPLPTSAWWKPCRVVGFDLSGDESREISGFRSRIETLFTFCAPITIHAGEAATAESVWQAVYRLGARRIGHGLRLRENKRLLNYCVTEGICMEMCPLSNKFTNGFADVSTRQDYHGQQREYYPLRYYLDLGLDVCINTDNRQLHGGRSLTEDYMCAARMVGGLTKWEILKIVKAGFKHAFLPKNDIEALLEEVENEVYQLVSASA
jgi:adenosine deaminase